MAWSSMDGESTSVGSNQGSVAHLSEANQESITSRGTDYCKLREYNRTSSYCALDWKRRNEINLVTKLPCHIVSPDECWQLADINCNQTLFVSAERICRGYGLKSLTNSLTTEKLDFFLCFLLFRPMLKGFSKKETL